MFVETLAGIIRENGRAILMQKNTLRIAIVVGCILLIPLWGNMYVDGWNWGPFDFVIAGAILFGTGLAFQLVASKGGTLAYRVAVGIALATALVLFWINAAVGIIGEEDLANAMYLGVIAIGVVGAFLARFESHGMSRAMVAAAISQALVPVIALTWVPAANFAPGVVPVMCLNGVFVAAWLTSAFLFRYAGGGWQKAVA